MHQQQREEGEPFPIRTEAPRLHVWLNICSSALRLRSNKRANKRGHREDGEMRLYLRGGLEHMHEAK
ncbi:hypothetical protein CHARACLAT_004184 [Characodon lateralis]|uniref:Uncharacterized protein n=1 Tax=Characodon lateralis TaxID=208331 RepID=A0ABU7D7H9_9TELE|nr:hypothetical protein [Characodon lateralis]